MNANLTYRRDDADAVDAVYTWVDGSSETFRKDFAHHTSEAETDASSARRFRDNNELRFSMRSVTRFAPWIRRVHLVTNGDVPAWLDPHADRLALVRHDDIFIDPRVLPTFNSRAIELCLHRIPNLSRKFIYLNDDCLFGRPIARAAFGDAETDVFCSERLELPKDPDRGALHDRAYAYTARLVSEALGGRAPAWLSAHVPQIYDRDVLARLVERFAEICHQAVRHRVRAPTDFALRVAYPTFVLGDHDRTEGHHARILEWGSEDYSFLAVDDRPLLMLRRLFGIWSRRPRFFCLNDDLDAVDHRHPVLRLMRAFLQSMYPLPSPFERA